MSPSPSILSNMAFAQSRLWTERVVSICRSGESPDQLGPLRQAMRLFLRRRRFDVVLTMGPRPSLAYGVLCAILAVPSRQIMTEVFLDPARPRSMLWRFKTLLFRWVAKRSFGVLTNSSAEVELIAQRFRIPRAKLRFVPMHTTIERPRPCPENDGTIVSIGRTARDLDTLFAAARIVDAPFVVVAGRADPMPAPIPPNLKVYREISLAQAHALLARAAIVAIPLLPTERSTGQVVLFEAMAMGKPVVATRAVGTADYVRDGENGLLVEPGNAEELAEAISGLLADADRARVLSIRALGDCSSLWTPDAHAGHKLQAIAELLPAPKALEF